MNSSSGDFDVPNFMLQMSPSNPGSPLYEPSTSRPSSPPTQDQSISVPVPDQSETHQNNQSITCDGAIFLIGAIAVSITGVLLLKKSPEEK